MKFHVPRLAAPLLAALVASAPPSSAQESRWQPFVSFTPIYEGTGDFDRGGDFSTWGAIVRAGALGQFSPGVSGGVTFNYDYFDYSFSSPTAFGGTAPWSIVQRYGVAVPLSLALRDDWLVGFAPTLDWLRENGADTGDASSWGAILSATKLFAGGNRLGLGVGVYDRIEKTVAFPFVIVDWRLSDRWRLINPLPAGPAGGAGLELDYVLDGGWTIGVGGAWRSARFRLSESGPVPNGVGEERGAPLFLRATWEFGRNISLHLYAGAVVAGEVRVDDPSGNRVQSDDFGTTPFLAATFAARF
jgi:hypothetical protein